VRCVIYIRIYDISRLKATYDSTRRKTTFVDKEMEDQRVEFRPRGRAEVAKWH
jgi:hypothetical protein